MAEKKKLTRKNFIRKIRVKYRLKILDERNFEEKVSLRLSALNVFVMIAGLTMFFVIITIYLVAFTSLREYIPGYADPTLKGEMYSLMEKTDSLENVIAQQSIYLDNLGLILQGKEPTDTFSVEKDENLDLTGIQNHKSELDSQLRSLVSTEDNYNIGKDKLNKSVLGQFLFYKPISGSVTDHFDADKKHYGIDVAAKENEPVKAVLSGIVIFSGWTVETGYVLVIQHPGDILSVYKHNASLLKKDGNAVRGGEPIAIVGNSGEYTTGPHLHFELWTNGRPIDPEEVIDF